MYKYIFFYYAHYSKTFIILYYCTEMTVYKLFVFIFIIVIIFFFTFLTHRPNHMNSNIRYNIVFYTTTIHIKSHSQLCCLSVLLLKRDVFVLNAHFKHSKNIHLTCFVRNTFLLN